MEAKTGQAQEDGASREEQASKVTWRLFTWFSIINAMFVTAAKRLRLRWKNTWWLFTWFSIRNAIFVTTSQRLRLRWKDTWWSITWFYSWHPFLLKPQSMVLDPSKKKCIRLLDCNILGDSKTLIHRVDFGSIKSQFLNSCIQKRLYWCVGQLFYCKNKFTNTNLVSNLFDSQTVTSDSMTFRIIWQSKFNIYQERYLKYPN